MCVDYSIEFVAFFWLKWHIVDASLERFPSAKSSKISGTMALTSRGTVSIGRVSTPFLPAETQKKIDQKFDFEERGYFGTIFFQTKEKPSTELKRMEM